MKHKILDILQIMIAIIITGSTAFAMKPPPAPAVVKVVQKKQQSTAKVVEKKIAPVVQEKPAEAPKAAEPAVVQPKAETAPVAAVEAPKPDNFYKEYIYGKESGNCPTRWQGEYGECPAFHGVPTDLSTGYGLCQSTPASKMAVMGPGWETSYELQDQWCSQHATQYGGWAGSYAFWLNNHFW